MVFTTFKKIDDYENIYSVSPFRLLGKHASEYIEEKGVNNYLIFDSTDENKELLKKIQWCLEWSQKQNRRSK